MRLEQVRSLRLVEAQENRVRLPGAPPMGFLIFDSRFLIERRDGEERSFELRFAIVERE